MEIRRHVAMLEVTLRYMTELVIRTFRLVRSILLA